MTSPQVSIGRPAPKKVEFKQAVAAPPSRLVISLEGPPKTGKTEFALSAPGPIAIHNFDLGLEGVVEKFLDKKVIYPFEYQIPISARLPGSGFAALADPAARVWEEFVTNYRACLDNEEIRTIILDTGSEMWNLCRLARLGKLTQVLPIQYTAVNAEFRQLTQLAMANTRANVIYIHRVKPVYKNEQKTEETERSGFGEIEYDVQSVLRTTRDYSKAGPEQFGVTIQECRGNIYASGKELRAGDCTFKGVARAIYPDAPSELWD